MQHMSYPMLPTPCKQSRHTWAGELSTEDRQLLRAMLLIELLALVGSMVMK